MGGVGRKSLFTTAHNRTKRSVNIIPSHTIQDDLQVPQQTTHTTDNSVEPLLEPRHAVLLLDLVLESDSATLVLPSGNSHTGSAHDDVEVHTEDTDTGVVLDTQVDVLRGGGGEGDG